MINHFSRVNRISSCLIIEDLKPTLWHYQLHCVPTQRPSVCPPSSSLSALTKIAECRFLYSVLACAERSGSADLLGCAWGLCCDPILGFSFPMHLWFWGSSLVGETVLSTGRSRGGSGSVAVQKEGRKEGRKKGGCCLGSKAQLGRDSRRRNS